MSKIPLNASDWLHVTSAFNAMATTGTAGSAFALVPVLWKMGGVLLHLRRIL